MSVCCVSWSIWTRMWTYFFLVIISSHQATFSTFLNFMNFILFQLRFLKFKSKIKFIKFKLHNYAINTHIWNHHTHTHIQNTYTDWAGGQLPAHFLPPIGKLCSLPYHILGSRNDNFSWQSRQNEHLWLSYRLKFVSSFIAALSLDPVLEVGWCWPFGSRFAFFT